MNDISIQALLRGDPEIVAELLASAERGDVDAQYRVGLICAEGRGVAQDEVSAYYWLNRAVEQGDAAAGMLLQVVAATMTEAQYRQARQLAEEPGPIPPGVMPAVGQRRAGSSCTAGASE